jgi:hypothetical protein
MHVAHAKLLMAVIPHDSRPRSHDIHFYQFISLPALGSAFCRQFSTGIDVIQLSGAANMPNKFYRMPTDPLDWKLAPHS